MITEDIKKLLKKQHYEIVGTPGKEHSAVQVCRWTKNSLRDEGVCYKEKFYGIKSHLCCQMTPAVMWCPNKCIHCWRAIENTIGEKLPESDNELDTPKDIVDGCIKAQRKLLRGFKILPETKHKTVSKANMTKWNEAQEPMQFAISLSGEPTVYKHLGGIIKELRKRGKTSFLVTNGLYPKKLKELKENNQLPTQLYISVNSSNKKDYERFHRSCLEDAWKRLNESIKMLQELKEKTRTVFRINLIRGLNMSEKNIKEFAQLIKKAQPQFIEVKGYMSVGFARERLGYDRMPTHKEMKEFCLYLEKELVNEGYKILDEQEVSRVLVLGKNKEDLKIKKSER